jgi:DNA-binding response OmpR family regulator
LIVDESAESREILRTLLELRGVTTFEAPRPEQAIKLAEDHHPDLIVFDADSDQSAGSEATGELGAAASQNHTPIVVLGTVRRFRERLSTGQFVAKPYHYGPLIGRIEELLAAS